MKRYIRQGAAMILAASMCFGLTACGNKGEKTNKTETKTLAQELGFGYLSEYYDLNLDLDWINSNNVSTAQGKLYFGGDFYSSDTGENRTKLYEADPATGTTKEIPTPTLSNEDGVSEYVQQVSVCPDGSGYWMLINTYRYSTSVDGTENAEAPIDDTAETAEDTAEAPAEDTAEAPAEDTAEAPVDDTAEAPVDDTAETAEDTAGASAEEEVPAENAETAAEPDVSTEDENTYTLKKYDMSGNLQQEIDLTDLMAANDNDFYPQYIAQDGQGNLYLASDSKIVSFGTDGARKDDIELQDQWIMSMLTAGDGTVVLNSFTNGEGSSQLCKIENGAVSEPIEITGDCNVNALTIYSGAGSTLMASDGTYLYSIDLTTGAATRLLSWLDSDINAGNVSGVAANGDDQIIVLDSIMTMNGPNRYDLGVLTKTPADQLPERTVLTLGAEYLSDILRDAVIAYNRKSNDYRITLVDYSQYNTTDDYTLGTQQLDRDVVSGSCPDIVFLSTGHEDKYIAKGALADLSALMEKDDSISQDELVAGALKAYSVDGKVYGLPVNFSVETLVASAKLAGDRTSWTMEEMAQVISGLDEGTQVMSYTSQTSFLGQMVSANMGQFVDYAKGTCSFDSDSFKQLLAAAAKCPTDDELNQGSDTISYSTDDEYTQIQSGDLLLAGQYISDGNYSLKQYYNLFNREHGFVNIGYPVTEDGGNGAILHVSGGLAISAKTQYTDAAWDFLKSVLSDDVQKDNWSLPVTKTALDQALSEAMEKSYYTDENGEKVYYDDTTYIGDTEYTMAPLTQEQVDDFKTLIDGATPGGAYDIEIQEILQDEAGAYFAGDKTADEVAKLIQNRVSIYLGETS